LRAVGQPQLKYNASSSIDARRRLISPSPAARAGRRSKWTDMDKATPVPLQLTPEQLADVATSGAVAVLPRPLLLPVRPPKGRQCASSYSTFHPSRLVAATPAPQ